MFPNNSVHLETFWFCLPQHTYHTYIFPLFFHPQIVFLWSLIAPSCSKSFYFTCSLHERLPMVLFLLSNFPRGYLSEVFFLNLMASSIGIQMEALEGLNKRLERQVVPRWNKNGLMLKQCAWSARKSVQT